jgi:hypothetical protein
MSKQGEVLLMQRMGITKGFRGSTRSKLSKKTYEELFDNRSSASRIKALRELLPACGLGLVASIGDARARLRPHRCPYFSCLAHK